MINKGSAGWVAAAPAAILTAAVVWALTIVGPATHAGTGLDDPPTTQDLARLWDREHVAPPLPPLLTHADVVQHVAQITSSAPDLFAVEEIGRSVEGRSLHHLRFGKGPMHVMLWSQMHGDEPTATAALIDLHHYVRAHRTEPIVRRMLEALTIHTVPMLNPDGAERFQRRNAQEIDINRDAVRLQTPEGRALKALRDRIQPTIGFNLHNQNWSTSVGFPPKPASISLLAVSFDRERSDNERRILAKKVSAVIRDAIEPLLPGQVGRYDDEFEVRAFGDNIAKWGTGVVLIETGPAPGPEPDKQLVRANFVALVTALDALASGRVRNADPKRYETLPFNESRLLHTLVKNATLIPGTGVPPYIADIGISGTRVVRRLDQAAETRASASTEATTDAAAGTRSGAAQTSTAQTGTAVAAHQAAELTWPGSQGRTLGLSARIADLGDLQTSGALETIDATGLTAAPLWDAAIKVGDHVSLPDFVGWKGATIAIGQPANVVLLAPLGAGGTAAAAGTAGAAGGRGAAAGGEGRYRVERVIRLTEPDRK